MSLKKQNHCSYYPNTTRWNNWTFTCVWRITLSILFHLLQTTITSIINAHAIIKKKQRNANKTTTKQNQDKRIWLEKQHTFAAQGFFMHLRCGWGWSSACIHTTTTWKSSDLGLEMCYRAICIEKLDASSSVFGIWLRCSTAANSPSVLTLSDAEKKISKYVLIFWHFTVTCNHYNLSQQKHKQD